MWQQFCIHGPHTYNLKSMGMRRPATYPYPSAVERSLQKGEIADHFLRLPALFHCSNLSLLALLSSFLYPTLEWVSLHQPPSSCLQFATPFQTHYNPSLHARSDQEYLLTELRLCETVAVLKCPLYWHYSSCKQFHFAAEVLMLPLTQCIVVLWTSVDMEWERLVMVVMVVTV